MANASISPMSVLVCFIVLAPHRKCYVNSKFFSFVIEDFPDATKLWAREDGSRCT